MNFLSLGREILREFRGIISDQQNNQGHPFPEMFGGFWCLVSTVDFLVDFFVDFFGPFSLGKQAGKNPPKNPPKNQGNFLTKIHSGKFLPGQNKGSKNSGKISEHFS